ncbi:MAG: hypothetical protein QF918_08520 [Pirellulaceae bacterium]|jgi:hypothetical protein|nr:hypothetical protein [Pirellulaceae bacterium]
MSETLSVTRDGYEKFALAFQVVQIADLNETLKENGITDKELRREICARHLFGIGNFLDQYWFEAEGNKVYPMLSFSERFIDIDTDLSTSGTHYIKDGCAFHESAFGNVDYFFDELDEDAARIPRDAYEDDD